MGHVLCPLFCGPYGIPRPVLWSLWYSTARSVVPMVFHGPCPMFCGPYGIPRPMSHVLWCLWYSTAHVPCSVVPMVFHGPFCGPYGIPWPMSLVLWSLWYSTARSVVPMVFHGHGPCSVVQYRLTEHMMINFVDYMYMYVHFGRPNVINHFL